MCKYLNHPEIISDFCNSVTGKVVERRERGNRLIEDPNRQGERVGREWFGEKEPVVNYFFIKQGNTLKISSNLELPFIFISALL